jgi:Holliday junction resolvase RusA-like endonuclease
MFSHDAQYITIRNQYVAFYQSIAYITFQQKVKQTAEKRPKMVQIKMKMYMKISPTKAAVTIKNALNYIFFYKL